MRDKNWIPRTLTIGGQWRRDMGMAGTIAASYLAHGYAKVFSSVRKTLSRSYDPSWTFTERDSIEAEEVGRRLSAHVAKTVHTKGAEMISELFAYYQGHQTFYRTFSRAHCPYTSSGARAMYHGVPAGDKATFVARLAVGLIRADRIHHLSANELRSCVRAVIVSLTLAAYVMALNIAEKRKTFPNIRMNDAAIMAEVMIPEFSRVVQDERARFEAAGNGEFAVQLRNLPPRLVLDATANSLVPPPKYTGYVTPPEYGDQGSK